jgi:putative membrane protein
MENGSMTTASVAQPVAFREYRMPRVLFVLFAVVWVISAIHPVMVADWWLENLLVFLAVGMLVATYRWLPFSELSYLLIFVYLAMHEWGAHHMYANVPIGEWVRLTFHTVRNDYDRVVHFAFGALLAYPQREILMRKANVRGAWALGLPIVITLGLSAAYELLEAVAANLAGPELADGFLSLQGDPWDTHKDMAMGLLGAAVAMGATAVGVRMRASRALAFAAEAGQGGARSGRQGR